MKAHTNEISLTPLSGTRLLGSVTGFTARAKYLLCQASDTNVCNRIPINFPRVVSALKRSAVSGVLIRLLLQLQRS
jgi:hypothetical protein